MRKTLKALAAVVALAIIVGVVYGWSPPERKQANEDGHGLTYVVWPWPSGETNDPHGHVPALLWQPALTPSVVAQVARRGDGIDEYPAWFVDSQSADGRYELRSFVDNANDYWYVKNLKTGRMLVFRYGTVAEDPVWQGDRLIVDSRDFGSAGTARLHIVVNLDQLAVEKALLLKWQ